MLAAAVSRCEWRSATQPSGNVKLAPPNSVVWTPRLSGPMRLEEGMNLAHRQGDSLFGFFPGEDAHFGLWREHRALHGDGVGVRGDLVRQHQDWVLATAHEIACHGEDEVGV